MPTYKYDWETWFSKPSFAVVKGEHYLVSSTSFAQQIRNQAATRGLSIRLRENDGVIKVTIMGPSPGRKYAKSFSKAGGKTVRRGRSGEVRWPSSSASR